MKPVDYSIPRQFFCNSVVRWEPFPAPPYHEGFAYRYGKLKYVGAALEFMLSKTKLTPDHLPVTLSALCRINHKGDAMLIST